MKKTLIVFGMITALAIPMAHPAQARDKIYVSGYEKLFVLDGRRDELIKEIPIKGYQREMHYSPDSTRLYVTHERREKVAIVDTDRDVVVGDLTFAPPEAGSVSRVLGLAVSNDGKKLFTHTNNFQVLVDKGIIERLPWTVNITDLRTGKVVKRIPVPKGDGNAIYPLADSRYVYLMGRDIWKIDVRAGKVVEMIPLQSHPVQAMDSLFLWWQYRRKGGYLIMPYYAGDNVLGGRGVMGQVWIEPSGKVTIKETGPPIFYFASVISNDRKRIYSIYNEVTYYEMEEHEGKEVLRVSHRVLPSPEHPYPGSYYSVDVSSDDKKVYGSGAGPDVMVLDAHTGKILKIIDLPTETWHMVVVPK